MTLRLPRGYSYDSSLDPIFHRVSTHHTISGHVHPVQQMIQVGSSNYIYIHIYIRV